MKVEKELVFGGQKSLLSRCVLKRGMTYLPVITQLVIGGDRAGRQE